MICFIIPPHILSEIKKNGSQSQKAWAEHAIRVSTEMREKRKSLLPQPPAGILLKGEGNKSRIIYTADNTIDLPGQKIRSENQGPSNDPAVDEAYFGTGATFDLYYNTYQRNSIDNKGMSLISTVHYSKQYDNAYWDGQKMAYGDGDGDLFELFTKPIDVTGH